MIRLRTFGTIDLESTDGAGVAEVLAQPKRLGVLLYLAAAAPHGFHRRGKLASLFWPDADEERARHGLSKAIHFLRRQLGEDAIATRGPEDVGVNPDLVWCDAAALEQAGLAHVARAELYRGTFADGLESFGSPELEHWLDARRAHLRLVAVEVAMSAATEAARRGDQAAAVGLLERATQWDPLNEALARALMLEYSRTGNRAAAIAVYQGLARRMRQELEARPSAETRALAEALRQTPPTPPRSG